MVSFRMMWVTRVGGISAAPLCLRVLGVQESSYTIFLQGVEDTIFRKLAR